MHKKILSCFLSNLFLPAYGISTISSSVEMSLFASNYVVVSTDFDDTLTDGLPYLSVMLEEFITDEQIAELNVELNENRKKRHEVLSEVDLSNDEQQLRLMEISKSNMMLFPKYGLSKSILKEIAVKENVNQNFLNTINKIKKHFGVKYVVLDIHSRTFKEKISFFLERKDVKQLFCSYGIIVKNVMAASLEDISDKEISGVRILSKSKLAETLLSINLGDSTDSQFGFKYFIDVNQTTDNEQAAVFKTWESTHLSTDFQKELLAPEIKVYSLDRFNFSEENVSSETYHVADSMFDYSNFKFGHTWHLSYCTKQLLALIDSVLFEDHVKILILGLFMLQVVRRSKIM